ncbi:MAG: nodulation protein NodZ [Kiritimatiellia bacterium]
MAPFPFLQFRKPKETPLPPPPRSVYTRTQAESILFRNRYPLLPLSAKTDQRYIIAADINPIYSGLGCMIRTLAPCWAYAVETKRTLVIDWRGNPYTRGDPSHNLFPSLFEPVTKEQAGIPVIADQTVDTVRFPQPLLTTSATMELEDGSIARMPNGGLDHDALAAVIANCIDCGCPTVLPSLPSVFRITRNWVVPAKIRLTDEALSRCYRMLRPKPIWRNQAGDFHRDHMDGRPVIGLHIRHGNGEGDFRAHFRQREISDFEVFMDRVARVVERYGRRRFGENYTVFVATDSDLVIRFLRGRLPRLITRPVWRPEDGEGIDFDHVYRDGTERGIRAAGDALVDMLLLAKCDAVMITRFTSFAYHVRYTLEQPDAEFFDDRQFSELAEQLESTS